jgi:hypothetical protein
VKLIKSRATRHAVTETSYIYLDIVSICAEAEQPPATKSSLAQCMQSCESWLARAQVRSQ